VKGAISPAVVRRLALAKPEATAGSHFGTPDFRVRKKIFATLPETGGVVVVKSEPASVEAMLWLDGMTYADAWRGRWLRVRLDRVKLPVLRELIDEAWRLAAPKRLAAALELKTPPKRHRTKKRRASA
jgi:hypothetical protein